MFLEKITPKKKGKGLKDYFDFRNNQKNQIGLILFCAFVLATTIIYQFEERFSESLWKSQPTLRYKLADDIIDRELFIGKSQKEIISILGRPSNFNLNGDVSFRYNLGVKPSFSESTRVQLLIVFNDNKVSAVSVVEDL